VKIKAAERALESKRAAARRLAEKLTSKQEAAREAYLSAEDTMCDLTQAYAEAAQAEAALAELTKQTKPGEGNVLGPA
jgi:hypothetical protein